MSKVFNKERYQKLLEFIDSDIGEDATVKLMNAEFCNLCKKSLVAIDFLIPHVARGEQAAYNDIPWYKRWFTKPAPSQIPNMHMYKKKYADFVDEYAARKGSEVNVFSEVCVKHMQSYIEIANALIEYQDILREKK